MTENVGAGAVVITTAQIFAELRALHDELRDTRAEVRQALADSGDHEQRIRSLERRFWMALGVAVTVGALVGAFVALLLGWGPS